MSKWPDACRTIAQMGSYTLGNTFITCLVHPKRAAGRGPAPLRAARHGRTDPVAATCQPKGGALSRPETPIREPPGEMARASQLNHEACPVNGTFAVVAYLGVIRRPNLFRRLRRFAAGFNRTLGGPSGGEVLHSKCRDQAVRSAAACDRLPSAEGAVGASSNSSSLNLSSPTTFAYCSRSLSPRGSACSPSACHSARATRWRQGGDLIERHALCLADQFEPVQCAYRREYMCFVGPLACAGLEQALGMALPSIVSS